MPFAAAGLGLDRLARLPVVIMGVSTRRRDCATGLQRELSRPAEHVPEYLGEPSSERSMPRSRS